MACAGGVQWMLGRLFEPTAVEAVTVSSESWAQSKLAGLESSE